MKFIPGDNTDIYIILKEISHESDGIEVEYIGHTYYKPMAIAAAKHLNRREENSLISYSYITVPKLKDLPLGEHKQK